MATGVTYENLETLTLNNGETYTSCIFRNIGTIINDYSRLTLCTLTNVSITGDFYTMDRSTFTDSVVNITGANGIYLTEYATIYNNCTVSCVSSVTLQAYGITVNGGSYTVPKLRTYYNSGKNCVYNEVALNITTINYYSFELYSCTADYITVVDTYYQGSLRSAKIIDTVVKYTTSISGMNGISLGGSNLGDLVFLLQNNNIWMNDSTTFRTVDYSGMTAYSSGTDSLAGIFKVAPRMRDRYTFPNTVKISSDINLVGLKMTTPPYSCYLWSPLKVDKYGPSNAVSILYGSEYCNFVGGGVTCGSGEYKNSNFSYSSGLSIDSGNGPTLGDGTKVRSSVIDANTTVSDTVTGLDLRSSTWITANLNNKNFVDCDLRGVNFDGATLTNCTFKGTDISGATFVGAVTTGSDFSEAINVPGSYTKDQSEIPGLVSYDVVKGTSSSSIASPGALAALLLSSVAKPASVNVNGWNLYFVPYDELTNGSVNITSSGVVKSFDKTQFSKYLTIENTVAGTDLLLQMPGAMPSARYYVLAENKGSSSTSLIFSSIAPVTLYTNDANTLYLFDFTRGTNGGTSVLNWGYALSEQSKSLTLNEGGVFTSTLGLDLSTNSNFGQLQPTTSSLLQGSSFTVEFSVLFTSLATGAHVVSFAKSSVDAGGIDLKIKNDKYLEVSFRTSTIIYSLVSSVECSPFSIYNVQCIYDEPTTTLKLYLNGNQVAIKKVDGSLDMTTTSPLFVGASTDGTGFLSGHVKAMSISNVARANLTAAIVPKRAEFLNDANTLVYYNFLMASTGDTTVPNIAAGAIGQYDLLLQNGSATIVEGAGILAGTVYGTCAAFGAALNGSPYTIEISLWALRPSELAQNTGTLVSCTSYKNGVYVYSDGYYGYLRATAERGSGYNSVTGQTTDLKNYEKTLITLTYGNTADKYLKLYINGVLKDNDYVHANPFGLTDVLAIGADYQGNNKFNGYIESVVISNVVRTPITAVPPVTVLDSTPALAKDFINDADTLVYYNLRESTSGDTGALNKALVTGVFPDDKLIMSTSVTPSVVNSTKGLFFGGTYMTGPALWPYLTGKDWTIEISATLTDSSSARGLFTAAESGTTAGITMAGGIGSTTLSTSLGSKDGSDVDTWYSFSNDPTTVLDEQFTVAITYSATTGEAIRYFNGVQVGTPLALIDFLEPSSPFLLGSAAGGISTWRGYIRDVAISQVVRAPVVPKATVGLTNNNYTVGAYNFTSLLSGSTTVPNISESSSALGDVTILGGASVVDDLKGLSLGGSYATGPAFWSLVEDVNSIQFSVIISSLPATTGSLLSNISGNSGFDFRIDSAGEVSLALGTAYGWKTITGSERILDIEKRYNVTWVRKGFKNYLYIDEAQIGSTLSIAYAKPIGSNMLIGEVSPTWAGYLSELTFSLSAVTPSYPAVEYPASIPSFFVNDDNTLLNYNFLNANSGDASVTNGAVNTSIPNSSASLYNGTSTIDPSKGLVLTGSNYAQGPAFWPYISNSDWTIEAVFDMTYTPNSDSYLYSMAFGTQGTLARSNKNRSMALITRNGSSWVTSYGSVIELNTKTVLTQTFEYSTKIMCLYINGVLIWSGTLASINMLSTEKITMGACRLSGTISSFWYGHLQEISVSKVIRAAKAP